MVARSWKRYAVGAAAVAGGLGAFAVFATQPASATPWAPSGAQLQLATQVAHQYATMTAPGGTGGAPQAATNFATLPAGSWPSNVQVVSFVEETRAEAAPLVHTTAPSDSSNVLVIRMTGSFVTNTTPPPPPDGSTTPYPSTASGKFMTLVVDATTGEIRDFALENTPVGQMPTQAVTAFAR